MSYITKREMFILGYLYYLVSDSLSENISPGRARCVSIESQTPIKSYKEAYSIALAHGAITKKIEQQISILFPQIHASIEDGETLSLDKRAAWQSGYYFAFNGWPLPKKVNDDNGIFELRTSLGMTQEEFANLVGLSPGTIGKAEIGERIIAESTMEKIKNIVKGLSSSSKYVYNGSEMEG